MVHIIIGDGGRSVITLVREYQKTPKALWSQLTCFVEEIPTHHWRG